MDFNKMTDKYAQGTVWKWASKKTVQKSNEKDNNAVLLIVSNTDFNRYSSVVNGVLIADTRKDSATNVPIFLEKEANVQCEQIHTVNKNELVEFMGIVPEAILSEVKAKLRAQFDCDGETPMSLLLEIRNTLKQAKEPTGSSFGVVKTEEETVSLDKTAPEPTPESLENTPPPEIQEATDLTEDTHEQEQTSPSAPKKKGRYTEDDIEFILNTANSHEAIMEKYGIRNKQGVHELRYRFRKRNEQLKADAKKPKTDASKSLRRKYTDDEIAFLLDTSNSTEAIMERLGLKTKNSVYTLRYSHTKRGNQSAEA